MSGDIPSILMSSEKFRKYFGKVGYFDLKYYQGLIQEKQFIFKEFEWLYGETGRYFCADIVLKEWDVHYENCHYIIKITDYGGFTA